VKLVLEQRDLRVAVFICLLTGGLVGFVYLLMNQAVERQLLLEAEHTSQNWAHYFSKNIEDLEQIAEGEKPSAESLHKMALARQVGNVFRYKIFSDKGLIRYVSDEPELTGSGTPSLANHNLKAARAVSTGKAFTQVKDGKPPNRPKLYAETYLPLMKNGRVIAVVEVYVDQSKHHDAFKENFLIAILIPMGIIAFAFGAPAAAFYIRTRQKEQADRTALQEHRRLKTALDHMSQALCMFDADQKLEIANDQYGLLYNFPPDLLVPGTSLRTILEHRISNGVFAEENPEKYIEERLDWVSRDSSGFMTQQLNDGRTIAITHEPKPGGGWVATHTDITDIRAIEDQVDYLAHYDSVTDLPNRNLFQDKVKSADTGKDYAVLCLDLDNFKAINDTMGHAIGDKLLRAVAERAKKIVGEGDTVSRLGNDEFAIIQASSHQPANATLLAERLCESIRQPFEIDGHEVITDVSIGIAIAPADGSTADDLIRNADIALSLSRLDGRGNFRFFESEMDMHMKERRQLETDLRSAHNNNEFELYYQPLISMQTEEVCGFEALLRWNHPTR
jgi:diguanylate cyclase (GGDEF)-like protein